VENTILVIKLEVRILKKINEDILEISKIISKNFTVKKIILFGSYAKGLEKEDSDIDICILTDENIRKIEILRKIRRTLYDYISIPLDLLIYRTDEFYERADKLKSIEREIEKEGVAIYG